MFVNVLAGEQVEVAITEEGNLREYYVEMLHQAKVKGNIYKGVIHNLDPNLQAAFVSYGASKNGFLQIDEIHPEYYLSPHEPAKGHKYPLIQKVLKAGQEILVQVVKEPSGSKGAFLTSYLSLPGRYLVLTPGNEQIGISRKVGNDAERARLREILEQLKPGQDLGVIVRTASEGANKTNLQRDLRLLKRLWQDVRKKGSTENAPAMIYQELGLAARAVRDYLTEDITDLWINDEGIAEQMREIITLLFPKRASILQLHNDPAQSFFERFGLAKQIRQVQSREVTLPSGGRLIFDHTEALTAIDINSGRSGGKNNFEDMAFKINLEAARHIPLQLRLRDIGGQIVVDFIEMRDHGHWREVEKTFRAGMKEDRARHDVGKISSFGLLEVVRQRLGSSAISIASEPCPHCKGTGIRRNMEWQAMQAMQEIQQLVRQNAEPGKTIAYSASGELIVYILNRKKEWLLDTEQEAGITLELSPSL
ncbi:MAG: Rne/Rng family ribonuclease [Desulfovibrionaceae bacterium]|nr:Rne/Rng family ribonuclease [Desulfovibrionaceae bacterium]